MTQNQQSDVEDLRTQIMRLEEDVEHLLNCDQVTGLLNRSSFISQVDADLKSMTASGHQATMIEIGINDLPRVAGSLGRHVGDYLVSALAARLHGIATPHERCGRLDYRSFAVYCPGIEDPLEALQRTKQLLDCLCQPVDWIDRKLVLDVSAGVAVSTPTEHDAATLLQNAGLALRTAHGKTGKNSQNYSFFNPALAEAQRRRADVCAAINEALEHGYFSLNYQPFFDCHTGKLRGFETLARLNHPKLGFVSPAEFIPVAEETGLITRLGAWALTEACCQAAAWPEDLIVAVNVSPEQFKDNSILTDVHNALQLSSCPASRLEIEITESTMLVDSDLVLQQIKALRELGCAIVLDDFGTGYSSLSYIWKFPFSKIKLDRAFIQAMEEEPRVRGMLQSIMDLSRHLGLEVTAEGIETEAQAAFMRDINCDVLQGYLCGKPVPVTDVAAIVAKGFAQSLRHASESKVVPLPLAAKK